MNSQPVHPLVTIGIPVRNGAKTLRYALDSCLRQTFQDIEVVVSDNGSSDETPQIIEEYCRRDPRVRSLRQDPPVSMWGNHRATFEAAQGKYFMWGADDDVLGDDWVEVLLGHLEANPEVGLAYGSLCMFTDHDDFEATSFEWPVSFDSRGLPTWRRMLMDKQSGYVVQGLFRKELLDGYEWWEHTVSPDWPFLVFLLVRTEIVKFDGPMLYRTTNTGGSAWDRSVEQSYRPIESYPTARLSWRCGLAARAAGRVRGQHRVVPLDAFLVACSLIWANRRHLVVWQLEGWQRAIRQRRSQRRPSSAQQTPSLAGRSLHALQRALDRDGYRWLLAALMTPALSLKSGHPCIVFRYKSMWGHWYPGSQGAVLIAPDLVHASPKELDVATRQRYLHRYTPSTGDIILDVGAGFGSEVLTFARLVGPAGLVVAIEAHPAAFRCLELTCRMNQLHNVRLVNAAISDTDGTVVITDVDEYEANSLGAGPSAGVTVDATTLDSVVEGIGSDERVAFLKMNIEGAERPALAGMKVTVSRVDNAAIECHDFRADESGNEYFRTREVVERFWEDNGFSVTRRPEHPWVGVRDTLYVARIDED